MSIPWRRIGRIGLWVLAVVVTLAVVATVMVTWAVRRSFPDHGGQLRLRGLSAPVTVIRDAHGVPQIYAQTTGDLFRAQGYVHAQDRFWEMDFRRHVTAGRVAELFGEDEVVETDSFLRTMGWRRVAVREWDQLTGDVRDYLTAYADGVNAWLDQTGGASASGTKSLEYTVLGLQNSGYSVERWSPVDSLAWLKAMAWDLRGNMSDEIDRAAMLAHGLSRSQIEQLYPAYPFDRNQPILTGGHVVGGAFDPDAAAPTTPEVPGSGGTGGGGPASVSARLFDALSRQVATLTALTGLTGGGRGIGSNSFVVDGSHTASGKPILANDPHLSPSMPGIWYQVGLHCACGYEAAGFTFSGVPGVIIGHNARIAWGFTNLNPDVTDLYLEYVQGDRYLVDGAWQSLRKSTETIKVAGGDDVPLIIRESKHGPLISDASDDIRELGVKPPVTVDAASAQAAASGSSDGYAIALRWTALDPGRTVEAIFAVNTARNWADAQAAAALFEVPAQNIVYADVDGNIGYQSPGRIPVRGKGDGRWMAPGWDSAYDWTGVVPAAELPSVLNPPAGVLVTANQAVIGPQYEHRLTDDWSYGYRSQRIADLLAQAIGRPSAPSPVSIADVGRIQFDSHNEMAATLVPTIRQVPLTGRAIRAQALLTGWDYQQPADGRRGTQQAHSSAAAAYYNAFWRHLLRRTFDELPDDHRPDGDDRWFEVILALVNDGTSVWWDDVSTPQTENALDVVRGALTAASDELFRDQGGDPAAWRWGRMHTLTLENPTFGQSGIGPIEWLFNHGPNGVPGGSGIVNANGWNASGDDYSVTAVPSMRMIVDLSNLDGSQWIQLTGNSGHAFHPNYRDQFDLWRVGEYLPMRWERATIVREAAETLTLKG